MKVLITGAAGLFGGILREHWGGAQTAPPNSDVDPRYALRLADVRPVGDLAPHEEFMETDIVAYDSMRAACHEIDVVVHLAAYPGDGAEFYDVLLRLNMIGAYNAFHAAHAAGCKRVIFASSIDTVMGYAAHADVAWDVPGDPTNVYGASKCWGEALGRVYAHQHGLSCICLRLCNPHFEQNGDWDAGDLISGISRRDAAQLFARSVDVEDVDFAIVNGISNHRRGRLDLEVSRRVLGYEPEDGSVFPRR